jgi:hypothetical protein
MVGEKGGRLAELVGIVRRVMNEAGEVLVKGGYDSLGAFVEEALRDGKERSKGDEYKWCEHVVERLVKEIPGFQDMYEIDGQRESFPSYSPSSFSAPIVSLAQTHLTLVSSHRRSRLPLQEGLVPPPRHLPPLPLLLLLNSFPTLPRPVHDRPRPHLLRQRHPFSPPQPLSHHPPLLLPHPPFLPEPSPRLVQPPPLARGPSRSGREGQPSDRRTCADGEGGSGPSSSCRPRLREGRRVRPAGRDGRRGGLRVDEGWGG